MIRRLAGAALVAVLALAACRTGRAPDSGGSTPAAPTATAAGDGPTAPAALLRDPGAAATATAGELLAAGRSVTTGAWADLTAPRWRPRMAGRDRPVYVADVALGGPGAAVSRVEADVVIAARGADRSGERIVLRLLPAAGALDTTPEVSVRVDGRPVEATVDTTGARLLVPLEETTGEPVRLRIDLAYDVPPLQEVTPGGDPAGAGLLARRDGTATLVHWLPLLTLPDNRGPTVAWGDVGAFPAAVWSVTVRGPGRLVTGGSEGPCPRPAPRCRRARGVGLRDLSAVSLPGAGTASTPTTTVSPTATTAPPDGDLRVRVIAPERDTAAVRRQTRAAVRSFRRRLGPLPWRQLDTVPVPLRGGVAGMELPGLSLIDTDAWGRPAGGLGTYVVAHEVAHQWFHALVGNGSLSDPVVDEALAQYLTVVHERDARGAASADRLAQRFMRDRYRSALAGGLTPAPPARPLTAFAGAEAYGALVYGRAPLGLLAAEEAVGARTVTDFLAGLVDRHGLGVISDDQLRREAAAADPALGEAVRAWWFRDRLPEGALRPSPALRSAAHGRG